MSRSVLLSVVFAIATPAFASEFTPESRVAEVTVYRQAALIVRETRLTLPAGSHRIVLKGIPCVADPDSVRVSGTGTSGIEIGGVEVREDFLQPNLSPEYKQAEKDLQEIGRRQSLVNDRRQSIATLREFLAGLKATGGQESSKGVLTKGFAVESWQKAFDFFSSRLNALSEEERALEAEQGELGRTAEVARGRLSQVASQGGVRRWSASVFVSAPRGGEMTLRASYLASNATWQPLYDARLDPATERVSLSWLAQVRQSTGEDWKDVGVVLATTRPSAGIDLPVLASLRMQSVIAQNDSNSGGFVAGARGLVLGRSYEDTLTLAPGVADVSGETAGTINLDSIGDIDVRTAGAGAEYARIKMMQAQATRREVAVTFSLPGRMDIPSDGQPHKHLIATREMEGTIEHRAVPQIVPAVFLVATVTLPGEVPLLPGRVQHFVGGDLVGSSLMTEYSAGETVSLSFGPDDRLKAERKRLLRKAERRGKDDEVAYRFVTTLENHLGKDGVVEVKDRIPVSDDGRIVVTLDEDETTPGALTDGKEPGVLTWKIPVPKGGKKEIELTYRVRSPRSLVLAGLE